MTLRTSTHWVFSQQTK